MITPAEATAQVFWTTFQAMPKKEREVVLDKFLSEKEFFEDLIDIVILRQRESEQSRPLEHFLAKRKAR